MELVIQLAVVAVAASVLALVVGKKVPELALLLAMCAGCVILLRLAGQAREIAAFGSLLRQQTDLPTEIFAPLLKIVGISIVVEIAASFCKDAGEGGLGAFLKIAGCLAALCAALPLMHTLMSSLEGLL